MITRNGRAIVVLPAPTDDDLEGLLLARLPRFRALLSRLRQSEQWAIAGEFLESGD